MAKTEPVTKSLAGAAILHGGDLDGARTAFPLAPEPWIDLSTGINPWPYPLPAVPPEAWSRLPSRAAEAGLRAAASACYGAASPDLVAAAPGSQALIQLLPRLRAPGTVAVLGPTYAEHADCWAAAGHQVVEAPALDGEGAPDADVLVVVNPNNPDGRILPRETLLELAGRQAARGGWLVLDEAFVDLAPWASLSGAAGRDGLVILRSFGKFFGLAGLRLGIALAPAELAAELRRAIGPWAVSGPALAIASAALSDAEWIAATRARLAQEAEALDRLLLESGLSVLGGTALFRLAATPRAAELHDRLGRAGILVRPFSARREWLRFGLPPDEGARDRLRHALSAIKRDGLIIQG